MALLSRRARRAHADAIAAIYNEGIEDRLATFETRPRSAGDVARWLEDGFPLVVVEEEGAIVAWASAAPYRPGREAYAGIGEFSVYVARSERGRGLGRAAMEALVAETPARGFWKLVSRIFPENEASLALCQSLGFREVGVYRRHGKLAASGGTSSSSSCSSTTNRGPARSAPSSPCIGPRRTGPGV